MANITTLSNEDFSCLVSSTFRIVSITLYVILCPVTIFGNMLILISIFKYASRFKGSLYMLIGNLAVADLLLGVWLLLFVFEEIVPEVQQLWYYCVAKVIGVLVSFCCSILSLLAISIDRFMAVVFPLKHFVKSQKRKFFMVFVSVMWIIAIISGGLPITLSNLEQPKNKIVCKIGAIVPRDFDLITSIGLLLTVLVNFILYGIVIWKIRARKTLGNSNLQKKSKKTVLMIIVFVIFVVCWLPFIICSFLMQANLAPSNFTNVVCIREYLAQLGLINSALNWVVYGLANKKFRTTFKTILYCNCCRFLSKPLSFSSDWSRAKSAINNIECNFEPKTNIIERKPTNEYKLDIPESNALTDSCNVSSKDLTVEANSEQNELT